MMALLTTLFVAAGFGWLQAGFPTTGLCLTIFGGLLALGEFGVRYGKK
jgi:hypothetical protein